MKVDNASRIVMMLHMATTTKETRGSVETFVTLLQRHRLAAGLTQTGLASKLKVVPSTVSYWESGVSTPHPKMIPKLARILGIDAMTLTRVINPESKTASA